MKARDKLLRYFGVGDYKELIEYIDNNPTDSKVLMIGELLEKWGIDFDEENYRTVLGI